MTGHRSSTLSLSFVFLIYIILKILVNANSASSQIYYRRIVRKYPPLFSGGEGNILPFFVLVWRISYALIVKGRNHSIKSSSPHLFKPSSISKPFYNGRTNCIVSTDKCSTIPSLSQRIITVATQSPYHLLR